MQNQNIKNEMLSFKYVHSKEDDGAGAIGITAFGNVLGEMKYFMLAMY